MKKYVIESDRIIKLLDRLEGQEVSKEDALFEIWALVMEKEVAR